MSHQAILTLTTDFGTRDGFVGQMKGVILRIHPEVTLVDITHDIEPFDVLAAALVVRGLIRYYPERTTHVAVVDPGVGSQRRGIALRCNGRSYVGPDNGLFTYVLKSTDRPEVREISNPYFMLPDPHPTFHGRDIFAPAAAILSKGIAFERVGPPVADPVLLSVPRPKETEEGIMGEIVYKDRFGNLISNIEAEHLSKRIREVKIGDLAIDRISRFFSETEEGRPVALINSFGLLEIAVNRGNASQILGIGRHARVAVVWDDQE